MLCLLLTLTCARYFFTSFITFDCQSFESAEKMLPPPLPGRFLQLWVCKWPLRAGTRASWGMQERHPGPSPSLSVNWLRSPPLPCCQNRGVLSFRMLSCGGLFPDQEGDSASAADDHGSLGLLARGRFRHRQENQLSGTWGGRGTFWGKVLLGHRRVGKTFSFLLDVVVTVCDSWTHCCHCTTMTRNVIYS